MGDALITPDHFYVDEWEKSLNTELLTSLIARPSQSYSDLDLCPALLDLVRDELELSGTNGGQKFDDEEMRIAIRALTVICGRANYPFNLPFRDHTSWRSYWLKKGASGSWQARRELLLDLFEDQYAKLVAAQDRALESTLVQAISRHERLGWPTIDLELDALRRHFRTASTSYDYRAVGNDCVHIIEALSRQVYVHAKHSPPDEKEPPPSETKKRLDRYIDACLDGSKNKEVRKFARSVIELAQAAKHKATTSRTEAGIAADAVIILANMLRRLDGQP